MPTRSQRSYSEGIPTPGASEFSHGPGLAPPGVSRYCGTEAGMTVSGEMTADAVHAVAQIRRGLDD